MSTSRGTFRRKSPTREFRRTRIIVDHALHFLRSLPARCFNTLKNACRVATRYTKTVEGVPVFIDIVLIRPVFGASLWTDVGCAL